MEVCVYVLVLGPVSRHMIETFSLKMHYRAIVHLLMFALWIAS